MGPQVCLVSLVCSCGRKASLLLGYTKISGVIVPIVDLIVMERERERDREREREREREEQGGNTIDPHAVLEVSCRSYEPPVLRAMGGSSPKRPSQGLDSKEDRPYANGDVKKEALAYLSAEVKHWGQSTEVIDT